MICWHVGADKNVLESSQEHDTAMGGTARFSIMEGYGVLRGANALQELILDGRGTWA